MNTPAATLAAAFVLSALLAPTAHATGKVYGDYGQQYQDPQPNYRHSDCGADVAIGTGLGAIVGGVIGNQRTDRAGSVQRLHDDSRTHCH